jgi:hypothetical protein
MAKTDLTAQRLRELLSYDPETGVFTRLVARGNSAAGSIAGTLGKAYGYIEIIIDRENYRANRLAWFYMTGEWPQGQVDHINGIRSDDRWMNLRDVPKLTNSHNEVNRRVNNTSGFRGCHQNPSNGRWIAQISVNRETVYLGSFDSGAEAEAVYLAAKRQHHAGFAG